MVSPGGEVVGLFTNDGNFSIFSSLVIRLGCLRTIKIFFSKIVFINSGALVKIYGWNA